MTPTAEPDRAGAELVLLLGSGASFGHDHRLPLFDRLLDQLRSAAARAEPGAGITAEYQRRIAAAIAELGELPGEAPARRDAEELLLDLEERVRAGELLPEVLRDIRMGIWWLYASRTEEVVARGEEGAYHVLAAALSRLRRLRPLVVNLSWDEALERTLEAQGLLSWSAIERGQVERQWLVKPHGSVGLIADRRKGEAGTAALQEWATRLEVSRPRLGQEPGFDWDFVRPARRPLLVYPGIAKGASHWYLWEARRRVHEALATCRVVIAVGVGLCRSDADIVRLVEHAMWHRLEGNRQLEAAFLVDLAPGQERTQSIQRFEEVLRPQQIYPSTVGFEAWVRNPEWLARVERILER